MKKAIVTGLAAIVMAASPALGEMPKTIYFGKDPNPGYFYMDQDTDKDGRCDKRHIYQLKGMGKDFMVLEKIGEYNDENRDGQYTPNEFTPEPKYKI